jgi:hypothetical protein
MKSLIIALLMINTCWASGSKHCHPKNGNYCVNQKVILNDGLSGSTGKEAKIIAIYENDDVEIQFNDGSANETLPLDNLADLTEHTNQYGFDFPDQPGLSVMSDNALYGKIVGKYINGDAEVKFYYTDNKTHRWPMARLSITEDNFCSREATFMCVNDFVAGRNDSQAKVIGIFEHTPFVMVRFFDKNSMKAGITYKKMRTTDLTMVANCRGKTLCNTL